jgi:uncharacterized protein YjbJ (UPF0337 family)
MSRKSRRDHSNSKIRKAEPDRATAAARDPAPGARNRPGFDLGGAVGDVKPDDRNQTEASAVQAKSVVTARHGKETGASECEAETRAEKARGKMRSAVAGVRNWLRGR